MDVYLQTGHQSQCCRLARFHAAKEPAVFPAQGFGTEAHECGPRSNKDGPCLLRLTGMTVTPAEFLAWFQGSFLKRYVTRVYWIDPATRVADTKEELLEILKEVGPPAGVARVQCNPKRLEQWLKEALPLDWRLDPRVFQASLSVLSADGKLHWSLTPAATMYLQSSLHCKVDSASSAIFKLEEALRIATLTLEDLGIAIDLGAAPGGWTMLLARTAGKVLAVDNADLAPESLLPNVVHIRATAQAAREHILRHTGDQLADLLVSDMNCHICEAVVPIKALLPALRPGGLLIVTMKFYGVGRVHAKWETKIPQELGMARCRIVWCLANTVNERMLIAWKH